ncbi:MAG: DUF2892 domain-containing protein [Alphaproteobacteria bacterium]|jgi:NCAIR mutase (PurE)-related protein|nr:DUF2892 domain-containing protein [Alphaproteobacteria bacterium]
MLYRKNVGAVERGLRIAAAAGLIAAGAIALPGTPLGYGLIAAGAAAALTGFVGFCPACAMIGRKPL